MPLYSGQTEYKPFKFYQKTKLKISAKRVAKLSFYVQKKKQTNGKLIKAFKKR